MGSYSLEIHRLLTALEALRGDQVDMPIQQVQALLAIAAQPGLSLLDLSEATGMSASATSRNVTALVKWRGIGDPGADFIEAVTDPRERRRKLLFLTAKGRQHVARAIEALTGEPTAFASPSAREALEILGREEKK